MDWRNTEVEVDLPNGACYQASIKDITESGILVVFKDDLKPETSIKFEKVRLLSHQDQEISDFKQGDIIQVYSKADEDTIEGWWKAKIQVLKGDNCYIEFIDRDGMDLVKKENIRPVNQGCEEDGIHSEFIKHSGVLAVIYSRTSSSLIFVSTSEDLNKKAELLTDLHVKALKEMLQQRQYLERNKHTETFMVTSDVAGLAIGRKHANIKKAECMKGIVSVTKFECDDGYLFKICGETPQAVKKARSLLEFKKEQLTVPHHFAGRIIGKAGKAIDEIIDKSMVDRIIRQTEQDGVVFNIIGTPESIENAKVLINFKLDALKNLYTSKIDIRDAERSDIWSDDENSSCFISSENISSIQHTPCRRRGNRTGRRSRGGKGNRFRGGQRGRNNHTKEESKQYQNYMKSNVSQQDVRATDKNDGFVLDSKTLVADSGDSSDDTLSCASINSEQHYPVHKPPHRSSWNGSRPRRRCRGGRGGRYRETLNSGDNQPSEDQISHFAYSCYLDDEKEGLWLNDNVGGIAFDQSSGGVRHKDIWNKPKAKDTGTRAEECYFPKHIEEGINKKHQGEKEGYEGSDEWIQQSDDSLSIYNNWCTQILKTDTDRAGRNLNSSIRGNGVRRRSGSRRRGGFYQSYHHQQRQQFKDESDEDINSDVEMMEVDDYSPSSISFDHKFSTSEDVTKSLANFDSLLHDTPKVKKWVESKEMKEKRLMEEKLDRINEMQVLKRLVQSCSGGCSFGTFICIASYLFPRSDGMREWFNTRSKRFHIYRDGSKIVYIAPFYKELNICKHFFNPLKLTICDNQNCSFFHVCRKFVRGNCRSLDCNLSHDFDSAQNFRIKAKYGLENFTDSDIIVLLNWKFPRLCPHYIYEHGGCKETDNKEEECPYLHYCKNYFFGKCNRGDNCQFTHSFSDSHNKWVLTSCHLPNQNEDALKRMIYVPPKFENRTEQLVNTEATLDNLSTRSREENVPFRSTNQYWVEEIDMIASKSKSKFIGDRPTIQGRKTITIPPNLKQREQVDTEMTVDYRSINETLKSRTTDHTEMTVDYHSINETLKSRTTDQYWLEGVDGLVLVSKSKSKFNENQPTKQERIMSYVPPNFEKPKKVVDTEMTVQDLAREVTIESTTNQRQTDWNRGFNRRSTLQSSFIGNQSTLHDNIGIRYSLPSESIVTEATPESDASLLEEAAGKKHICLALTKKYCQSHVCTDLHLEHGVPYLWQVKTDGEWVSFLPKDNFKIENAYCSLEQSVQIKDSTYSGSICTVHISFEVQNEHMFWIVYDAFGSKTNRADIRRLSTPSFGERCLSVDSYLTQWRWYWKNDHGVWLCYDTDLQTYTLEVKFLKQQKTYLFSRENYKQKYRLSFNSMEQVNLEYGTTRVLMRRPLLVSEEDLEKKKYAQKIVSKAIELYGEDSKPAHFYPWDLANEFELVETVSSFNSEYNNVLSSFQKTMNRGNYEVRSIYRVQSRKLWSDYETKKKHMHADAEKDNPTFSSIDERTLFHGTDSLDICRGICINNFDFRKSGKNATVFGEGSYFARDAIYSHNYTKPSSDFGDRYMFRAKVLVGKFTQGSRTYRRPPEIPGQSHKLYDSCVDHPIDPSIFVIFDRSQSYPEYLINYREKDYGQRRISPVTALSSVQIPPVLSAFQQPVHSSMPSTSAYAHSTGGTSLQTATSYNSNSISGSNVSRGTSSGAATRHNLVSIPATSMGNSSMSSNSNMHSSNVQTSQSNLNSGNSNPTINIKGRRRKQDKDCVIL
ncbi:poly [ADP-ribose] polymerase 7/11/12/13 [Mytilus galloprovincialis]|uniref:Poly [ADP-ribose] polymerase 7/11/12/13 n=1 Tax=Mytilus galloprovincialis TaxID=29158 RepID=A0A8B6DWE3_MYTGA|nr:poly [ADP-ribose] polymerase 7/11/12/13 [Mytilus galloprovincialis]